jgi:hypothetical protein
MPQRQFVAHAFVRNTAVWRLTLVEFRLARRMRVRLSCDWAVRLFFLRSLRLRSWLVRTIRSRPRSTFIWARISKAAREATPVVVAARTRPSATRRLDAGERRVRRSEVMRRAAAPRTPSLTVRLAAAAPALRQATDPADGRQKEEAPDRAAASMEDSEARRAAAPAEPAHRRLRSTPVRPNETAASFQRGEAPVEVRAGVREREGQRQREEGEREREEQRQREEGEGEREREGQLDEREREV